MNIKTKKHKYINERNNKQNTFIKKLKKSSKKLKNLLSIYINKTFCNLTWCIKKKFNFFVDFVIFV